MRWYNHSGGFICSLMVWKTKSLISTCILHNETVKEEPRPTTGIYTLHYLNWYFMFFSIVTKSCCKIWLKLLLEFNTPYAYSVILYHYVSDKNYKSSPLCCWWKQINFYHKKYFPIFVVCSLYMYHPVKVLSPINFHSVVSC